MELFTPKEYLLIDIANQHGLDNAIWRDRIEWVQDHYKDLESLDVDAQHPILYRKAVRALRTVDRHEPTDHIMGLDATQSGIQQMAVASGCRITATEVNLVDPHERFSLVNEGQKYFYFAL